MHKLIRVTTISSSLNILLRNQLNFLREHYEVIGVASDDKYLKEVQEREKIRVVRIPMKRNISIWKDCFSLIILIKLFYKEKPFIVHANTPKASLLSMTAAWITRVPHRIYTVTGLRFETTTGKFRQLLILMEKITCWCATKVIPEGEGVKKVLIKERITNKPLNVLFNGNINGIDTNYFKKRTVEEVIADNNKKKGIFTFCFVGRIVKDKGINELLNAFAHLYQENSCIRLYLVGPIEKKLDALSANIEYLIYNHPAISFVDFQQDIRPYLAASDAFVFPSYREGFPNVVLQAGAMELPSIVTDINGSNEIIENGINGVVIPPKDEKSLYDAMKYFATHHEEVQAMAKKARPIIEERFEQQKVWEALLAEYQSLEKE